MQRNPSHVDSRPSRAPARPARASAPEPIEELPADDYNPALDPTLDRAAITARQKRYRKARAERDPAFAEHLRERVAGLDGSITRFIAVDGEGTTDASGRHTYFLLCASDGTHIQDPDGLRTLDIFRFLWDLKRRHPNRVIVGFAFQYDINMILRDVPRGCLKQLWRTHETGWYLQHAGRYVTIEWIPQKSFRVRMGVNRDPDYRAVSISEVWGFFQSSFLKALKDWKIPDRGGAIARIEKGKGDRSSFRWEDIDEIRAYCFDECALLVDLMDTVARTLQAADLTPRNWQGAGSIAAAMLGREDGIREHYRRDDDAPNLMQRPILCAYYGGRFEVFQQGEFDTAHSYDINSAYPFAARSLPSLHGKWIRRHDYKPDARYALWRVRWKCDPAQCPVMPFPFRKSRRISFPQNGEGYYWADEVRAAIALWGDSIRVLDGWEYRPYDPDARPFDFIDRVWQLRLEAKAAGRAEQKAYKLGMNSLYGKLAQGVGYRGQTPRFRSFIWAGMITANTRAYLLRLAAQDPHRVIAMATDGIIFECPIDVTPSSALGDVDYNAPTNLFVAQSGIYHADGMEAKRRGYLRRELDFDVILDQWRTRGSFGHYDTTGTRFIGLGTAIGRRDPWVVWGRWIPFPRRLNLYPSTKFVFEDPGDFPKKTVRWHPPKSRGVSAPYVPKSDGIEDDAAGQYVNGIEQPE